MDVKDGIVDYGIKNNDKTMDETDNNPNVDSSDNDEPVNTTDHAREDFNSFIKDSTSKSQKGKYNTLNEGNVTYQCIFNIDSMNGDITSVAKESSPIDASGDSRSYNLYERQECTEFVSEYKASLHLAYAIATAMFEVVPVSDLQRIADSLLHQFAKFPKEFDENGKEINTYVSPFISLDTILYTIGAQTCKVTFTTAFNKITERCISFGDKRHDVMMNLWELFPMMRSEIISWLIETDFSFSYRNAFSINCFINALFNIVRIDFGDSMNRLFPQLTEREENKFLIIRLMLLMVNNDDTKKNTYEILRKWSISSKWLWEVSLVVYVLAKEDLPFSNELTKTLTIKLLNSNNKSWMNWDIYFICGQMVKSCRLRNIVAEILEELLMNDYRDKTVIARMYLLIACNAYQFVDRRIISLPLVAFDNKAQVEHIKNILIIILGDFTLRQNLFSILKAYIEEINDYDVDDYTLNRLKSFFYVISKNSNRFYGDIKRFLSKLQSNKIAIDILKFLQKNL